MRVVDTKNKKQYTADGTQTIFPFPYAFFKAEDLEVYIGLTLKNLSSDYSVSGINNSYENGGNITFVTAPEVGAKITIARILPIDQRANYKDFANFPNSQITKDLDRRAMVEQQLQENIQRQLALHITEDEDLSLELPPSDTWPGQFLGFDAEKKLMVGQPVGVPATEAAAEVLDDPTHSAMLSTLGVSEFAKTLIDDATAQEAQKTLEIVKQFSPTAGYAPAEKDIVEFLSDGSYRKAIRSGVGALAAGSTIPHIRLTWLDSTHCFVVYLVGTTLWGQIWTVNRVTGVPSPVAAATSLVTSTTGLFDCETIDATHVLLLSAATAGGQGSMRVLICDVTTGAITQLGASVNAAAAMYYFGLRPIPGTNNFLCMYFSATTTIAGAVISGGTDPVWNTPGTIAATQPLGTGFGAMSLSFGITDDGVIGCAYVAVSPYHIYACMGSISGTAVTLVAPVDTGIIINNSGFCAIEAAVKKAFVVFYSKQTGTGGSIASGVSVWFPSISGMWAINPGTTAFTALHAIDVLVPWIEDFDGQGTTFLIYGRAYGRGVGGRWVIELIRRKGDTAEFEVGDTVEWVPPALFNLIGGGDACRLPGGDFAFVAIPQNDGNNSQIMAVKSRSKVFAVIGADGFPHSIGIMRTSGLTPGAHYFLNDDGDLSTTPSDSPIGFAPDATHLVLQIRPGV